MGRSWCWSKKNTVEESLSISMVKLREWGYLNGFHSGNLTWTDGWGNESSVGIWATVVPSDRSFIRLNYTITDRSTDGKEDFNYEIQVVSTPCNYGGYRWWFLCPLIKDGFLCHRRVYKIYKPPGAKYFGCRNCYTLTYRDRQEHNHKLGWAHKFFNSEKKIEKICKSMRRTHYDGSPTKKYRQYLKYERLHDYSGALFCMQMEGLFKKRSK